MKNNAEAQDLWGKDDNLDLQKVFQASMGYASSPGWSVLYQTILEKYQRFEGLDVVELGCGQGKVSIIFSLLGAHTTLFDYSDKQLSSAKYIHTSLGLDPEIINGNILSIPDNMAGRYDVAMSFGTAEHFWADDRQTVFDSHARVLKPGGLVVIWVPNIWGILFHIGYNVRKLLRRPVSPVDETSFTRRELFKHAEKAGLINIRILGAEDLKNDFHNFIIKLPGLKNRAQRIIHAHIDSIKDNIILTARTNNSRIGLLNNMFSYPLMLLGESP